MFPCFDQPNIKGTLRLITISPSNWVVIGNEYEEINEPLDKEGKAFSLLTKFGVDENAVKKLEKVENAQLRVFRETKVISTYLYVIVAGPYDMFCKEAEGKIPPMRIFVRKSLKKFVEKDVEEFFYITKMGIEFYSQYFGYPFPFSKYDQIYVPEFNWGAMENAGAVTYTENLVFKDAATDQQYMRFSNIILHELSHHWFGDLVTMKWWNNLWLNESFATFISHLCQMRSPGLERYRAAWKSFCLSKDRAYREDQLPTTHPIAAKVSNTEEAENIFDGITYQKGSSVLKQLFYLVGEEVFGDGLKEYFPKYQWSNTELDDFIGCMQNSLTKHKIDIDLKHWVSIWLQKAGTNELQPEFKVKDGKITEFNIIQACAPYGEKINRMHRLVVGLYDKDFHEKLIENVLVLEQDKTPVPQMIGLDEPTAVFLNIHDYAYAKIRLDEKSFAAFAKGLPIVSDSLTRQMILRSVWDMVRDCIEPATKYLELLKATVFFYLCKIFCSYLSSMIQTFLAAAICLLIQLLLPIFQ